MIQRLTADRLRAIAVVTSLVVAAGCSSGSGRRPVSVPGEKPGASAPSATGDVQELYEAGRYLEVLNSVGAGGAGAEALWFAAQSSLRLGQREQAAQQFEQVARVGATASWQVVSNLALALLRDEAAEIDRLRAAAAAFPSDPFVQYELGLAHARRNDMAAAAEAFDGATRADPRFAYAYYNGGLTYDRLNRTDLAIARLEMFERLAPNAPERPEVRSILQTVRSR